MDLDDECDFDSAHDLTWFEKGTTVRERYENDST